MVCILGVMSGCIDSPPLPSPIGTDRGWNIISLPETINKNATIVAVGDEIYTWNDAVENSLVLNNIYEYKPVQGYVDSNVFERHKGYFVFFYNSDTIVRLPNELNVITCQRLQINGSSTLELNCTTLIIAPEYYNNTLVCKSIDITGEIIFKYKGESMP